MMVTGSVVVRAVVRKIETGTLSNEVRKAKRPPATRPGRSKGSVTCQKVCHGAAARTTLLPRAVMKVGLDSATPNQRSDSAVGGKRAILSLPNATPTATTIGRLRKARTAEQ